MFLIKMKRTRVESVLGIKIYWWNL